MTVTSNELDLQKQRFKHAQMTHIDEGEITIVNRDVVVEIVPVVFIDVLVLEGCVDGGVSLVLHRPQLVRVLDRDKVGLRSMSVKKKGFITIMIYTIKVEIFAHFANHNTKLKTHK